MPASSLDRRELPIFGLQSHQSERLGSAQNHLQDQSSVARLQQRQPSSDEWELWKADIYHWYIEENKTLEDLRRLVCNKHNFRPTIKQLTRRLDQWNFWKNKRQKQKKSGNRLIIRVQHRRSVSSTNTLPKLSRDSNTYEGDNETNIDLEAVEFESQPQRALSLCRTKRSEQPNGQSAIFPTRNTSAAGSISTTRSGSKEDTMNDLEERLSELSISFGVDISSFQRPSASDNSMPKEVLTAEELRGIESSSSFNEYETFSGAMLIKHSQPATGRKNPLKVLGYDVDFPSSILVPSLSGELYPFPRRPNSNFTRVNSTPEIVVLRTTISDYLGKFEALSRLKRPETDPVMIKIMNKLGRRYRDSDLYRESEIWYRRELSARQLSGESPGSIKMIQTELAIVDSINDQGRHEEAFSLHETIHRKIVNNDATNKNDLLVSESLFTLGCILFERSYLKDAEAFLREAIQIRLNSLGPWENKSLQVMRWLGTVLRDRKEYEECEKLLMITIQLHKSVPETNYEDMYFALDRLAVLRGSQGESSECEMIYRDLLTGAESKLGKEHPSIVNIMHNYSRSLLDMGQLDKSEKMARKSLDLKSKIWNQDEYETLHALSLLGEIHQKSGSYAEAAQCYEKTFRGYTSILGSDNIDTIWDCNDLAECYGELGRFEDALQLLGKFIQDVETQVASRKRPCWGDGGLAEIQRWIGYFKDDMEDYREKLEARNISEVDDELSSSSDDEDSLGEEETFVEDETDVWMLDAPS
ncbi:hypothetical protein HYFRA_00002655 [Hymenoscyphus fraxineus]|uniref:Clr5 domain-containing protein n=1 Tax=Hymenoscyphus fraxineus TaxID=746836 RepID=A0A9N9LBJ0_9HELO|nr:hypothetical protein HYFRA_00002655 [Hymenoscyphus fraxineus]